MWADGVTGDPQYSEVCIHISFLAHFRAQILDSRWDVLSNVQSSFFMVCPGSSCRRFPSSLPLVHPVSCRETIMFPLLSWPTHLRTSHSILAALTLSTLSCITSTSSSSWCASSWPSAIDRKAPNLATLSQWSVLPSSRSTWLWDRS